MDWVAFTPLQNATGDPAISLPLATTASGLPQGMMFGAGAGREATLIELAYELEEARPICPHPGLSSSTATGDSARPRRLCKVLRRCHPPAPLAQSAERLHGKEKVYGSIP